MSDSSKDHKPKREPTTCANCAQKIVPFGEYSWAHVLGNLMCSLSARPVAEPASTGEPSGKSNEAFWKYLDENREVVIRWPGWMRGESVLAARPSEPSAPQTSAELGYCESLRGDVAHIHITEGLNPCVNWKPAAPQPVSGDAPKMEEIELSFRRYMWLNHGHDGLYGDDGQMQCSRCPLDFKRAPLRTISKKLAHLQMEKLATPASTARKSPDSHLGAVRD